MGQYESCIQIKKKKRKRKKKDKKKKKKKKSKGTKEGGERERGVRSSASL